MLVYDLELRLDVAAVDYRYDRLERLISGYHDRHTVLD